MVEQKKKKSVTGASRTIYLYKFKYLVGVYIIAFISCIHDTHIACINSAIFTSEIISNCWISLTYRKKHIRWYGKID